MSIELDDIDTPDSKYRKIVEGKLNLWKSTCFLARLYMCKRSNRTDDTIASEQLAIGFWNDIHSFGIRLGLLTMPKFHLALLSHICKPSCEV